MLLLFSFVVITSVIFILGSDILFPQCGHWMKTLLWVGWMGGLKSLNYYNKLYTLGAEYSGMLLIGRYE